MFQDHTSKKLAKTTTWGEYRLSASLKKKHLAANNRHLVLVLNAFRQSHLLTGEYPTWFVTQNRCQNP